MTVKIGDKMPEGQLTVVSADGPKPVDAAEYFGGRKVALFAVPGAFTPTCSARHLPSFVDKADEIKAKGVDEIACIAVNDPFVMGAWNEKDGSEQITMLSDGNGDYTDKLGLGMDASRFGMGKRSQRYSMLVDDGTITQLNVEAPGDYSVSGGEVLLGQL